MLIQSTCILTSAVNGRDECATASAELDKVHVFRKVDVTEQMNDSLGTAELLSFLQNGMGSSIVFIDELSQLEDRMRDVINGADVLDGYRP